MQKLLMVLASVALLSSAFAGCSGKKETGDEVDNTDTGSLDESAVYDKVVADNGFRVSGTLDSAGVALTAGANGSAASASVVDNAPEDSGGALDKTDFLIDAKEADGGRLQAEMRSMVTAEDVGVAGDFFAGVLHNQAINGATGIGFSELPEVKAYFLTVGLARVKIDGESTTDPLLVMVAVTKGMRGAGGALLAAIEDDLEIHVLFPGSLLAGNEAVQGEADGFLYFFFENVKLTQLSVEEKATVGSRLAPPEQPNVSPVAVPVVRLLDGTNSTMVQMSSVLGSINVTLDASNSTDPDGTIEAYSWDVFQYNATGGLEIVNKTSGQTANFTFKKGGLKTVTLRVIDDKGAIATNSTTFVVNYLAALVGQYGMLQPVGAGTSCQPQVNCLDHQLTIEWNATKVTFPVPLEQGGTCGTAKLNFYTPTGAIIVENAAFPYTATDRAKIGTVGKYSVKIWWDNQANGCKYTDNAVVDYVPPAPA